jgi:hypothetical protein
MMRDKGNSNSVLVYIVVFYLIATLLAYFVMRIGVTSFATAILVLGSFATIGIFAIQYQRGSDSEKDKQESADSSASKNGDESSTTSSAEDDEKSEADTNIDSRSSDTAVEISTPAADTDVVDKAGLQHDNQQILSELGSIIADRVQTYEEGSTKIDYDGLNLYSRMMLYMIVKELDFRENRIQHREVTPKEIEEEFDCSKVEVMLFIDAAEEFLDFSAAYDYDGSPMHTARWVWRNASYDGFDELDLWIDFREITAAADWAIEEQQSKPSSINEKLDKAFDHIKKAQEDYNEGRKFSKENKQAEAETMYDRAESYILRACEELQYYPIEVDEDFFWDNFTTYADGLYKCYSRSKMSGIDHHIDKIKKYFDKRV